MKKSTLIAVLILSVVTIVFLSYSCGEKPLNPSIVKENATIVIEGNPNVRSFPRVPDLKVEPSNSLGTISGTTTMHVTMLYEENRDVHNGKFYGIPIKDIESNPEIAKKFPKDLGKDEIVWINHRYITILP